MVPIAASSNPVPASTPARLILGIDTGLQRTGYAILSEERGPASARVLEAGVVTLSARDPLERRLVELEESLTALIQAYKPLTLAVEGLYAHYKHPRTAILMAHARGVILVLAARLGMEVVHVPVTQAKKMLTGHGYASKGQMQRAVAGLLRLPTVPEPHDVADAMAIALCGLRLQDAARRMKKAAVETMENTAKLEAEARAEREARE